MTISKNYKEYVFNGIKYFVVQYMEKYSNVWLWRYGYVVTTGRVEYTMKIKDGLLSRPNLKRLFGS